MEKTFLLLALLLSNLVSAQGNFEQGMDRALKLWEEGKIQESSALFERIASAEKDSWLPNYYVALVNTTSAFRTKDGNKVEELLTKAQRALDAELNKNRKNPELMVLQAMIHTARIAYDPMSNGQKFSGTVMQLYQQAEAIAPENPRVVLSKAQFEMGTAAFFGKDTAPICTQIEKSILLFDNFNPDSPYHPKWGKEQAEENLKACGKS